MTDGKMTPALGIFILKSVHAHSELSRVQHECSQERPLHIVTDKKKAFKNIPPQLIDYVQGKLGNTSGEDLKVANALYNAAVAKDRNKISRLFSELFTHFKETINPSGNWEDEKDRLYKRYRAQGFLLMEDRHPKVYPEWQAKEQKSRTSSYSFTIVQ